MEIFLFTNFLLTMFWLILRARFMNLRQDYLIYFRPEYLAMTINKIVDQVPIKLKQDKSMQMQLLCENEYKEVEVYFIPFKVKINEFIFEKIWEKKLAKKKDYILPEEAENFMNNHMNITKIALYEQRLNEINNLDMMAPQTISDHPESIIEF